MDIIFYRTFTGKSIKKTELYKKLVLSLFVHKIRRKCSNDVEKALMGKKIMRKCYTHIFCEICNINWCLFRFCCTLDLREEI